MRGKDDRGPRRDFVHLFDEDRALVLKSTHHELVVDDLLAHVDRSTVVLQGALNGDHSTIDSRAIPARGGQQNLLRVTHTHHRKVMCLKVPDHRQ